MDIAKILEIIGCEIRKSNFQVDYTLIHCGNEYKFLNGLVLSNWTVYQPNESENRVTWADGWSPPIVYEFNEKEMKNYIFENFKEEIRDTQIEKILK